MSRDREQGLKNQADLRRYLDAKKGTIRNSLALIRGDMGLNGFRDTLQTRIETGGRPGATDREIDDAIIAMFADYGLHAATLELTEDALDTMPAPAALPPGGGS